MTTKEQRAALRAALQDARNVKCVMQVVGQTVAIDLLELVDEADRAAELEAEVRRLTSTSVDHLTPGMTAEFYRLDDMWQRLVRERDDAKRAAADAAIATEAIARIRYAIDMLDNAAHDSISIGAAVEWFDDCEPCTCGLRGCDRKPCKGQCGCVACSHAWADFLSME